MMKDSGEPSLLATRNSISPLRSSMTAGFSGKGMTLMAFLSMVGRAAMSGEEEWEFLIRLLVVGKGDGELLALRLFSGGVSVPTSKHRLHGHLRSVAMGAMPDVVVAGS